MSYLDLLPDELYRRVLKYRFADVLHQLEYGNGVPVYPIDFYYCFCAENSDYVRSKYLQTKWREDIRHRRGSNTLGLRDWWKLIMDLERPTVWTSAVHGWKLYSVRRWQYEEGGRVMGGLYWNSTYEKAHLTMAGWDRLSSKLSMDARDASTWSINRSYVAEFPRVVASGKRVSNIWIPDCAYLQVNGYTESTGFF